LPKKDDPPDVYDYSHYTDHTGLQQQIDALQQQVNGILQPVSTLWTPTLSFTTPGDLHVVYAVQSGTYHKFGNLVFITFDLDASTFTYTTATGVYIINGLPFAAGGAQTDLAYRTGLIQYSGINAAGYSFISGDIFNGGQAIFINKSGMGVPLNNVLPADVPSGGSDKILKGSLWYFTA
jgi:hypothetical protein